MASTSGSGSARAGTSSRRTPTSPVKRKLEEESPYPLADFKTKSTAKGDVEVAEVNPEGKFIRLLNKGEKVTKPFSYNFKLNLFKIVLYFYRRWI